MQARAAICCASALPPSKSTTTTAVLFETASYFKSVNMSLTSFLPRIPKGIIQSPCLQWRSTNGKCSFAASKTSTPSGCLRGISAVQPMVSTLNALPPKCHVPSERTAMKSHSPGVCSAASEAAGGTFSFEYTESSILPVRMTWESDSKRFPGTVLSEERRFSTDDRTDELNP